MMHPINNLHLWTAYVEVNNTWMSTYTEENQATKKPPNSNITVTNTNVFYYSTPVLIHFKTVISGSQTETPCYFGSNSVNEQLITELNKIRVGKIAHCLRLLGYFYQWREKQITQTTENALLPLWLGKLTYQHPNWAATRVLLKWHGVCDTQRHRQMTGTQSSLRGCNCLKISFVVNVKIKIYIYIYFNWKKRSKPHRTTRSFSKKAAVDHFNIKDFLKVPASKTGWVVHTSCFPWDSRRNAKTKNSAQIGSYPFWCFSFFIAK